MRVPLLDLAPQNDEVRPAVEAAIARVLTSNTFIGGPELDAFEKELAEVEKGAAAVGVSSGTDALLASLMALGVGAGDEVVTSPFSFFATAGVVSRLGARPVFADIEEDTFNLDPVLAAAAVSDKTRAIMPVHLFGRPATLPNTTVPIIEDAAQAIGAAPVRGACSCLSFFPSKNLGAFGDGGAVVSNDLELIDRIRLLRNHGGRPKYYHAVIGGNFRLDALQAAILRAKLPRLASWTAARQENARRYRGLFAAAKVPAELRLPGEHAEHTYNQFVVRAPMRDALRDHLGHAGVGTEVYYPRALHQQPCFDDLGYREGAFPVAEKAAHEALALPVYPGLGESQQAYVVNRIAAFYARGS